MFVPWRQQFLRDDDYDKMIKEVYSQLTVYENAGHTGVTAMLFCIVILGALLTVYTLILIAGKTHRWSIQTFHLIQMLLFYSILMPITLLHPYIILFSNEFVMLSASPLQKYPIIQIFIFIYYMNFVYTFATAVTLVTANYFSVRWRRRSTHPMGLGRKIFLAMANIPLTVVITLGFGCFAGFVSKPGVGKDGVTTLLPGFAFIDVGTRLSSVILGIFCSSVMVYMAGCYGIHRMMERELRTSSLEEKSHELLNLELQMLFGCFYGALPFLIILAAFCLPQITSRILISEFVTFCHAVLPNFTALLALSAHRGLQWPRSLRCCRQLEVTGSQWALPRQSSQSGGF